jgi:undecaprenyl-diphosphatase
MDWLLSVDTQVFFLINHVPHVGFIDSLGLFLSGIGEAGMVWFVIGAYFFFKEESKDQRLFIPLGLAGAIAWSISELILKPLVARLRPSSALDAATVVGGFPLGYSFPSTHAALAFALAVVLAYKEPKWKKGLFLLAFAISLSRVYLGHHYPIDVIVGGLIGWGIGTLVIRWYIQYRQQKKDGKPMKHHAFRTKRRKHTSKKR